MDSTTQTSDGDIKLNSDLFKLAEKLRIELQKKEEQLQVKDQELAKEKQEKQELSVNLDLAMSRANRVHEMENGLVNAQQTIHVLQTSLWKSFPFPGHYYYIKTQSGSQNGQFLHAYNESGTYYLHSSADNQARGTFKFTKNSDGSFSIHSITKGYYLQTHTKSAKVVFACKGGNAEKFVLFRQQNQQPAISVDISTLAGSFLCMDTNNFVVANSRTAPAEKFLIIPVDAQ